MVEWWNGGMVEWWNEVIERSFLYKKETATTTIRQAVPAPMSGAERPRGSKASKTGGKRRKKGGRSGAQAQAQAQAPRQASSPVVTEAMVTALLDENQLLLGAIAECHKVCLWDCCCCC